ncbi:MAG TPA: hypothetical protein VFG08_03260 [Candidatus Polarisedimenticolia bacterium]|nr:hypothetical protein [Candidatus Polarisedimenticolia bacterium]
MSEKHDAAAQLDGTQSQYVREHLKSEQNLGLGILSGSLGAAIGAALWAVITVVTGWQTGFMAIGIGFLVGYAMRTFGRGVDMPFGIAGGALSLLGCLLGNLLSVCGFISIRENLPFLSVLSQLELSGIVDLMRETFSPMDLLFYGIAVYEGYRLSFRQMTDADLQAILKGPGHAAGLSAPPGRDGR